MNLILLIIAFLLCLCKSWLTYVYRQHWLYIYTTIPIGVIMAIIWTRYARLASNNANMFIMGLIWDIAIMMAYNILPFVMFGVRFKLYQHIAIGMIFFGLILFKLKL